MTRTEFLAQCPMEVHFHESGNTIFGNYSAYRELETAIERKSVPMPFGYVIRCATLADAKRLIEHVALFGYCIRTLSGWRNVCKLASVTLEVSR